MCEHRLVAWSGRDRRALLACECVLKTFVWKAIKRTILVQIHCLGNCLWCGNFPIVIWWLDHSYNLSHQLPLVLHICISLHSVFGFGKLLIPLSIDLVLFSFFLFPPNSFSLRIFAVGKYFLKITPLLLSITF